GQYTRALAPTTLQSPTTPTATTANAQDAGGSPPTPATPRATAPCRTPLARRPRTRLHDGHGPALLPAPGGRPVDHGPAQRRHPAAHPGAAGPGRPLQLPPRLLAATLVGLAVGPRPDPLGRPTPRPGRPDLPGRR